MSQFRVLVAMMIYQTVIFFSYVAEMGFHTNAYCRYIKSISAVVLCKYLFVMLYHKDTLTTCATVSTQLKIFNTF